MKDLPKVFANPIDKNIDNNRLFSYGKLENDRNTRDEAKVNEKLNKLFQREGNIYAIDCIITYESHEEKYTIIGKTDNNLVTKSGKLIPIREIYDIDLA